MNERFFRTGTTLLVVVSFLSLVAAFTAFAWGRVLFALLTFLGLVAWLWAAAGERRAVERRIEGLTRAQAAEKARLAHLETYARLLWQQLEGNLPENRSLEDCLAGQSVMAAETRFLLEEASVLREDLGIIRPELVVLTAEEGPALGRKLDGLAALVEEVAAEARTVEEELAHAVQELAALQAELFSLGSELGELAVAHGHELEEGHAALAGGRESLGRWTLPREELGEAVQTATDLAEQARILGVNASIETLRSGESGRGFSLVAEEADRLSERMLRLAHQVATQIETTEHLVRETEERLEKGRASLDRLGALGRRLEERLRSLPAETRPRPSPGGELVRSIVRLQEEVSILRESLPRLLDRLAALPVAEAEAAGEKIAAAAERILGQVDSLAASLAEAQVAFREAHERLAAVAAAARELGASLPSR
ncbi:MAG: methyl-accepting chemotaxis protein [Bacillota bacterium]